MSFDKYSIQIGLRVEPKRQHHLTCEEMRQFIYFQSQDSSLISTAMREADIRGLSAEDRYTTLAYYALIQLEQHFQRVLELTRLMPMPPTILKEPSGK